MRLWLLVCRIVGMVVVIVVAAAFLQSSNLIVVVVAVDWAYLWKQMWYLVVIGS